ncbi:MAG: hypothetical protein ACRDSE_22245 [Pseudonocardiaceae bacterium]
MDVAGALAGVGPALPGSRSVGAADAVRQAWEGRGRSWSGELRGYGDGLSAAANRYASNEQAAEADLSVPTPQSGGGGPKAI